MITYQQRKVFIITTMVTVGAATLVACSTPSPESTTTPTAPVTQTQAATSVAETTSQSPTPDYPFGSVDTFFTGRALDPEDFQRSLNATSIPDPYSHILISSANTGIQCLTRLSSENAQPVVCDSDFGTTFTSEIVIDNAVKMNMPSQTERLAGDFIRTLPVGSMITTNAATCAQKLNYFGCKDAQGTFFVTDGHKVWDNNGEKEALAHTGPTRGNTFVTQYQGLNGVVFSHSRKFTWPDGPEVTDVHTCFIPTPDADARGYINTKGHYFCTVRHDGEVMGTYEGGLAPQHFIEGDSTQLPEIPEAPTVDEGEKIYSHGHVQFHLGEGSESRVKTPVGYDYVLLNQGYSPDPTASSPKWLD
ncbi:hypothetical protein CFELI_07495 [Corynebacterium felinum]|nr:hypothetical protein CFELI_07495 [Corynebacterium felinum]